MSLRHVSTDQADVSDLWKATDEETRSIRGLCPGCGGNVITQEFTGAGSASINHKLGKQPTEWQIVDRDANVSIWRTAWDTTTITIQASGAVNLKLRVV